MLTGFRFLSQREAYEKGMVSGMMGGKMSRFIECTKPISYLNKDEYALEKLISAMTEYVFLDFSTTIVLHSAC